MEIEGAVVLVTGASSGIGQATARASAKAGARVVLAARREDRLRALADELEEAVAVRCDVTDPAQVERAISVAVNAYGRLDVLVNNAGKGFQGTIEDTDPGEFRDLLELDLVAPLVTTQAVIPVMRSQGGGGSIINVSSGTIFLSAPGSGAYAAAKIGLSKLSEVARVELAEYGIAVSNVYPFVTSTEFIDSLGGDSDTAREMTSGLDFQPPERVADAILKLVRSGDSEISLVPKEVGEGPQRQS